MSTSSSYLLVISTLPSALISAHIVARNVNITLAAVKIVARKLSTMIVTEVSPRGCSVGADA